MKHISIQLQGKKYVNPTKNFITYFLSFNEGSRLELMQKPKINTSANLDIINTGFAHMAISLGSKEKDRFINQ